VAPTEVVPKGRLPRNVVPTLATTTMTIAIAVIARKGWPSRMTPANAATAGSRLISVPNVFVVSCRSAIISRV